MLDSIFEPQKSIVLFLNERLDHVPRVNFMKMNALPE